LEIEQLVPFQEYRSYVPLYASSFLHAIFGSSLMAAAGCLIPEGKDDSDVPPASRNQRSASRNSSVCNEEHFKDCASGGHGMPCPYMGKPQSAPELRTHSRTNPEVVSCGGTRSVASAVSALTAAMTEHGPPIIRSRACRRSSALQLRRLETSLRAVDSGIL